ncbi:MAG: EAL domain-containing protein [Firmicutes bacterium]|nr:EAL domain-containing protein [Bacillota bacterium]
MRTAFLYVYVFLMLALGTTSFMAYRSHKKIGKSVSLLNFALIPPVLGNFIVTSSTSYLWAFVGYYIYFIGMNGVLFSLIRFTERYCKNDSSQKHIAPRIMYVLFVLDSIQLALNTYFGHAFSVEGITVERMPYFRVVPYIGLTLHRLLDYSSLAGVILIFVLTSYRMPRVYKASYVTMLCTMAAAGLWQGVYIFLRIPVDRSMIGLAIFGLLVFFFALYYYPFRLLDRMLTGLTSEISEAVFVFDPNGNCIWINKIGRLLINDDSTSLENVKDELFDMFGDIMSGSDKENFIRTTGEGENERFFSIEKNTLRDDRSKLLGTAYRVYDYTQEHLAVKKQMYAATHDALTGLYTKEHLFATINERLIRDTDTSYLIAFVDIKNFKIVNDIFGKEFGDKALCIVADKIKENARGKFIYGRIAGDTFGVCLPKQDLDIEKTEAELARFAVKDGSLEYGLLVHIGIYEVKDVDMEVSVMFDRAHLSLSRIKDNYKTHIAIYDDEIRNDVMWRQRISTQLNEAIRTKQIRPYLQPIVDRDGKIVGAEALARWIHPENGFMSPASFIPVFEDNGMIVEVDRHMWRCACETLVSWRDKLPDMFISVNISPKDFYFTDVVSEINGIVNEYGVEPSKLRIEITETVMMTDIDEKMRILEEFRRLGFIVEMDDFGSGYSSLNMLKDMPVDVLKIDMKFLEKSKDDEKAQKIVKNIINLSEDLGIASLTEGVETEDQYGALSRMGCELFQGYYFAKPMAVDDFEAMAAR